MWITKVGVNDIDLERVEIVVGLGVWAVRVRTRIYNGSKWPR